MKKSNIFVLILPILSLSLIWTGCNQSNSTEKQTVYISAEENGELIADTIIYDVIIKNRDASDIWKEECLQYLNRSALVDSLFAAVYDGRHKAYDLFTGIEIDPRELIRLEKEGEITREDIGKIQFREIWYLNSEHMVMNKKILSMVLGIETYADNGEFRDYKPVFRINFN